MMRLPTEHMALLKREGFPVPQVGELDDQERDLLCRYGFWMEALVDGKLAPITPEQQRFLLVARGVEQPQSTFESAWVKHQRTSGIARPNVGPLELANALERLQSAQVATVAAHDEYATRRAEIMEKVRPLLEALDDEFSPRLRATAEEVSQAQVWAREAALSFGASFRHAGVHAIYSRGRVTWDTRGLHRYMESHPELAEFRRVGEPSVSLRMTPPDQTARPAESTIPPSVPLIPPAI